MSKSASSSASRRIRSCDSSRNTIVKPSAKKARRYRATAVPVTGGDSVYANSTGTAAATVHAAAFSKRVMAIEELGEQVAAIIGTDMPCANQLETKLPLKAGALGLVGAT